MTFGDISVGTWFRFTQGCEESPGWWVKLDTCFMENERAARVINAIELASQIELQE